MRFAKLAAALVASLLSSSGGLVQFAAAEDESTIRYMAYSPARPPAVPLAVRSPYLNVWLQCGDHCFLPDNWPRHWNERILGMQGLVAVDGKTYNWMGEARGTPIVNQTLLNYTSTKSLFEFDVENKVKLSVTFLSPVYPNDLGRQAQQFSYVAVAAESKDGNAHSVQIYMDVSGEFASGDTTQQVNWEHGASGNFSYHKFFRDNQTQFQEDHEIAGWGDWYLSTNSDDGMTWQIGQDTVVRGQFADHAKLTNNQDSNFRPVQEDWPVFAFSHDLGDVTGAAEKLFSLGIIQDQVIDFAGLPDGKMRPVPGLWRSYWLDDMGSVKEFFHTYNYAKGLMNRLDSIIWKSSVDVGGVDYATITSLSLRQLFGGLQYAGTADKPYIFLKEISSNSDIQTVDVIFPAIPAILYMNPNLTRYLLDPLFENQESGVYPNKWAIHDLGTFPVAKGYPAGDDEPMPLEECGNMIILTLAYAQRTGDTQYLKDHYPRLAQWADFLIQDSLIPANQLSTDDFAGELANQTNLAIKGIIGLKAMSQIANLTGHQDTYGTTADDYLAKWEQLAVITDPESGLSHTTLSYGDNSSHGLLYNIYSDKLLNLNFIPQRIYDQQSAFYKHIAGKYAVPLDTRHNWAKSDWEMFAAAVSSDETKRMFINKTAKWINETPTNRAMTDLFDSTTGAFPDYGGSPVFVARPVVGGMFALLALGKGFEL